MASTIIANDLDRMNSDIRKLDQYISKFESTKNKAFTELRTLNSMWEGPSKTVFMSQFENDAESVQDMIRWLKSYREELKDAYRTYTKCESDVSQIIRSINI